MGLQAVLQMIYPPQCISCDALVTSDFGLCGKCWRETPFIAGLVCDQCGTPLPGEDPGHAVHCDDCLLIARPWDQGRAALLYKDNARKMVLQMKHGDRTDLVKQRRAPLIPRPRDPTLRDRRRPGCTVRRGPCWCPICCWRRCRCTGFAW